MRYIMFRKIKYVLFLFLIVALSVSLAGCGKKISYPFLHGSDEIQEIQIAHIELDYEYQTFELGRLDDCIVLADIEDTSEFIEKFSNDVLFSKNWFGEPTHLKHGEYVIKITYTNGNFELIGFYAQSIIVQDDRGYKELNGVIYGEGPGRVYCSKDDFMNFINLYLDDPIAS